MEVRRMSEKVKIEKIERAGEARFLIQAPSFEELFDDESTPSSFEAFKALLEDVSESLPSVSVHIYKFQDGELSVNVEGVDTIIYYVERPVTTAFGTPYVDSEIVQLFCLKRHYLARKKKLYALDSKKALEEKLKELGLPLIAP
jgi:hypothetical protein